MTQSIPVKENWPQRQHEGYSKLILDRDLIARAIFFIVLHVPLIFLFRWNSIFPTIHALGTFSLGIIWLLKDREPRRLITVLAYISAMELIWRGMNAQIFYEFGKYAVATLLILGILKYKLLGVTLRWPIIFFVLLLPSIVVLPNFDRQAISFNLAGPLVMTTAILFFYRIRLFRQDVQKILIAIIAPSVGLGLLVVLNIINASSLEFTNQSNLLTSAGIGPNQVSSILGLGAFSSIILILIERKSKFFRGLLLVISIWLVAQTLLTFSRGGFWTALFSLGFVVFFLLPQVQVRSRLIFTLLIVSTIGFWVMLPILDAFTQNTLVNRFENFDTSGRWEIVQADLIIFQRNLLFGVGPDQSKGYHAITFRDSNTHTEYSRLLAEHGLFGLIALLLMVIHLGKRFFEKGPPWSRAMTTSFTLWGLLFMAHSATRLAIPMFLIGLATAYFEMDDNPQYDQNRQLKGSGNHK